MSGVQEEDPDADAGMRGSGSGSGSGNGSGHFRLCFSICGWKFGRLGIWMLWKGMCDGGLEERMVLRDGQIEKWVEMMSHRESSSWSVTSNEARNFPHSIGKSTFIDSIHDIQSMIYFVYYVGISLEYYGFALSNLYSLL